MEMRLHRHICYSALHSEGVRQLTMIHIVPGRRRCSGYIAPLQGLIRFYFQSHDVAMGWYGPALQA